jgi:hypothetical protein
MIDRKLQEISNWSFTEAINNPLYFYAIGVFLLLCLILYFIRRLKKDLINIFADDNGNVQITHNALHELVGKSCEEIPGVFCSFHIHIHKTRKCTIKCKDTHQERL